jgi:hypothetical protein
VAKSVGVANGVGDLKKNVLTSTTRNLWVNLRRQISWLLKVRRTLTHQLNEMAKESSLTVSLSWKKYNIFDCLINKNESVEEVKESTINAFWRKCSPKWLMIEESPM